MRCLAAAKQHQLAIKARVVAAIEEQPCVLYVDFGRCRCALGRIVLLDAIHKDHRLSRLAETVVDGADRLQILNVVFKLLADGRRNLLNLREGLPVAACGVERGEQALPCVGTIAILRQHCAVDRESTLRIVAREIDPSKRERDRSGRCLACGGLLGDGFFENLLSDVELVLTLIDGGDSDLKTGTAHRRVVNGWRHGLQGLQGLRILLHDVLDADEALPCCEVSGIHGEGLLVERCGLLETVGLLEETGVLKLGLDLKTLRSRCDRQIESGLQSTLSVGVTANRRIGGGQRAEEDGIAHQLRSNGRRDAALGLQGLRDVACTELGQEETAPGSGRGWLQLDVALEDFDCSRGLLGLQQCAAETVEGLRTGWTHGQRGAVPLLGCG